MRSDHDDRGGAKICQTETPAARATTSSIFRDRLRKAIIEPNSTANGSACSAKVGVRRNDNAAINNPVAFGASPERRNISTRSTAYMRKKTKRKGGDHGSREIGRRDKAKAFGQSCWTCRRRAGGEANKQLAAKNDRQGAADGAIGMAQTKNTADGSLTVNVVAATPSIRTPGRPVWPLRSPARAPAASCAPRRAKQRQSVRRPAHRAG